jgi:xylulose-5-phosphate/fructose-6-phosphate phosphoketolase
MEWAIAEIKGIQTAARSGQPIVKPRWPVLIMRTPQVCSPCRNRYPPDWFHRAGVDRKFYGEFIEGSFHSHQVPLPNAKTDDEELHALQSWLSSYNPCGLFHISSADDKEDGCSVDEALSVIPNKPEKKLGQRREAYVALTVPEWIDRGVDKGTQASCMGLFERDHQRVGHVALRGVRQTHLLLRIRPPSVSSPLMNSSPTRLMPSSITPVVTSNGTRDAPRLHADRPHGPLPELRGFLGIIQTMMVQYSKFVKMVKIPISLFHSTNVDVVGVQASETNWRQDVSSLNYLETSTCVNQYHSSHRLLALC